jgi:hypothetical protein
MTDHKNVKRNLLDMLKAFPSLAENYNDLCAHYWVVYDNATSVEAVSAATSAETITRNFRKLVELGMVKVPERTLKARQEKVREYKSEFKALV